MRAEVKENEVVKHWGIWIKDSETGEDVGWLRHDDGFIFFTTCPRVANVQHDVLLKSGWDDGELEVRVIK